MVENNLTVIEQLAPNQSILEIECPVFSDENSIMLDMNKNIEIQTQKPLFEENSVFNLVNEQLPSQCTITETLFEGSNILDNQENSVSPLDLSLQKVNNCPVETQTKNMLPNAPDNIENSEQKILEN